MLSNDTKEWLVAQGLTKQQADSITADVTVRAFLADNKDASLVLAEANAQVEMMRKIVNEAQAQLRNLKEELSATTDVILSIREAQEEHGAIADQRAKDALALYAALLNMNKKMGTNGLDAITPAGYMVYAYLGGQARRNINNDGLPGRVKDWGDGLPGGRVKGWDDPPKR